MREKCPNMELFLVRIFLYQFEYRKYGPGIIPYLDTFHAVSSITDQILAISPDRVAQRGMLNVELSDHQLIYCTKNLPE